MEKEYKILGFDHSGKFIIFKFKDKLELIKSTLQKSDLISKMNVPPNLITKDFKDCLLNEARLGGRLKEAYSFDGETWYKNDYYISEKKLIESKYKKFMKIEDYEKLNVTPEKSK